MVITGRIALYLEVLGSNDIYHHHLYPLRGYRWRWFSEEIGNNVQQCAIMCINDVITTYYYSITTITSILDFVPLEGT
jgi:hypothetical protein